MNLEETLIQYCEDVLSGVIPTSKTHLWAVQRFVDELEKQQTDDFAYYFDVDVLYDFYEWSRQFKHFKGTLKGQYIELTPFQLFLCANVLCWKRKSNGKRRFRKAYIQLARKNAKSQLLALIASYITFLTDDEIQEVYLAGWEKSQSKLVYEAIEDQINACELLEGKYTTSYGMIKHRRSGSYIKPLSRQARKTGDGTNPSVGIVDEYHQHETDEIYESINKGMGARAEPLMFIITTAGENLSSPCYTEYKYCKRVLNPDDSIENDRYFIMICETEESDDIHDINTWLKANPIANYQEYLDEIALELQVAVDVPEKMRTFLTKYLNRWVDHKEDGYLSLAKWNACGVDELPDLSGKVCYVGVDLSRKIDLTSVTFEFNVDGKYYLYNHSFMPAEAIKRNTQTDKEPYKLWVQQGWITEIDGEVVDMEFVEAYVINKAKEMGWVIKEICYDPWSATSFAQSMEKKGYMPVEIRQGYQTLSEPTKDFRERVLKGEVVHDKNPVLETAVYNAVTQSDPSDNIKLAKDKSTGRIDPIVATICSHVRAMNGESTRSVYEDRGFKFL